MVHLKYHIRKLRYGSNGRWNSWEYEAFSDKPDYKAYYGEQSGISARHLTIDSLARELSTYPGITNTSFVPEERLTFPGVTNVSYLASEKIRDCVKGVQIVTSTPTNTTFMQWSTVSDEELGELTSKIFEHYKERREKTGEFVACI